jgi:hypothetical protein
LNLMSLYQIHSTLEGRKGWHYIVIPQAFYPTPLPSNRLCRREPAGFFKKASKTTAVFRLQFINFRSY